MNGFPNFSQRYCSFDPSFDKSAEIVATVRLLGDYWKFNDFWNQERRTNIVLF